LKISGVRSDSLKTVGYGKNYEVGGQVARTEEMRNAYKIVARKSGGKRIPPRPSSNWEDNIKMKLSEIVFMGVD
jgi:hypothetical protein